MDNSKGVEGFNEQAQTPETPNEPQPEQKAEPEYDTPEHTLEMDGVDADTVRREHAEAKQAKIWMDNYQEPHQKDQNKSENLMGTNRDKSLSVSDKEAWINKNFNNKSKTQEKKKDIDQDQGMER